MSHQPRPIAASPGTTFSASRIRDTVLQLLDLEDLPPIVQAGHPVLRQHAAPYDGQLDDAELGLLIGRMRAVMHAAPGVGLAAPQLGIPLQLAVLEDQFDIDPAAAALRGRGPLEFFAMLNPRYEPLGAESASFFEGCLSVNGLQAVVTRHRDVRLEYLRPDGAGAAADFTGWQARIVQHETDHLHGALYLDRAELRSLSNNSEYSANWAGHGIDAARRALGFLND
ncbi:peptide deformylase [Arthrobacter sp. CJ23]|uniref:peptide deformylase n=1 Tax=Arthrobacter sp. CJ23 TaxID=2972479 RepID=UPI00215C614C|nr:peptide deformylase [Arthrobacter sp. CJ23]UVJ37753.1 peptide deformylase [Arthrobacter sp. CJ23]